MGIPLNAFFGSYPQDHQVSMTYGELYERFPILADCIESHEWDNMNISEQRDWALNQASTRRAQEGGGV